MYTPRPVSPSALRPVSSRPSGAQVMLCVLALAAASLLCAEGAEKRFVLAERLGRGYTNELVTFPFEAPKGACVIESVRATGPSGPVAAQLLDVETWPDTRFVRRARLAFVVDELAPGGEATYTVSHGPRPAATAAPATDLTVTESAGSVELTTSRFGVRLPLGSATPAQPMSPADVPGPIAAVRVGSGAWTGGSRLYGKPDGVAAWSARLTERGPVLARAEVAYTFADDSAMTVTVQVAAGDSAARVAADAPKDRPGNGWDFHFGRPLATNDIALTTGIGIYEKTRTAPEPASPTDPACYLIGWQAVGWFADTGARVAFTLKGEQAPIVIQARDPAAWVPPSAPQTFYGGFKTRRLPDIEASWSGWRERRIPFLRGEGGALTMRTSVRSGCRKWTLGVGAPRYGGRLDKVKDMVLDWPKGADEVHPRLVMDRAEVDAARRRMAADPASLKACVGSGGYFPKCGGSYLAEGGTKDRWHGAKKLKGHLAELGRLDVMRHTIPLAFIYDAIIDTGLLSPEEKARCRAQMAYLAYYVADPEAWDPRRGYCSGNPNMTCSYVLGPAVIGCLLREHPAARDWVANGIAWMERWLESDVNDDGVWLSEGMHYGQVSLSPMTAFAAAARKARFRDFFADPRFQKLAMFFAKQYTPPDPRNGKRRTPPSVGRGLYGFHDIWSHSGVFAKALAASDPARSKTFQWAWLQSGATYNLEFYMSGHDRLYCDPTLPAEQPNWGSELFERNSVLFRNGLGTANEHYVNLLLPMDAWENLDAWAPTVGSLATWFARGKPVSGAFVFRLSYVEHHELLRDGVLLARNYAPGESSAPYGYYAKTAFEVFVASRAADYARATFTTAEPDPRGWTPPGLPAWPKVTPATAPKLEWTRQALFLREPDPAGPHYLVFRDTTRGGQPTMWQFRTASQSLTASADAVAPAADAPEPGVLPARRLAGDRFTAVGQFGVDLEFFVAAPGRTPRHTLRYGGKSGHVPKGQFMDLLHLQLPGDGAYFVAVFPRDRAEPAPDFARLGDGRVIKASGAFGTDYAFLSPNHAEVKADGAAFKGTAAAVTDRASGLSLALLAPGEVGYKRWRVAAPMPVTLTAEANGATLAFAPEHGGGDVAINSPVRLALDEGASKGVTVLSKKRRRYVLHVARGAVAGKLVEVGGSR